MLIDALRAKGYSSCACRSLQASRAIRRCRPSRPRSLGGRSASRVSDVQLARLPAHLCSSPRSGSAWRGWCSCAAQPWEIGERRRRRMAPPLPRARAAAVRADSRLQRGEGDRPVDPPHPGERLSEPGSHRHRRRLDRRDVGPRAASISPTTARDADLHPQWRQGQRAQYRPAPRRGRRGRGAGRRHPVRADTISRLVRWFADPRSARSRATPRSATAST